jgi:hypothetical protein
MQPKVQALQMQKAAVRSRWSATDCSPFRLLGYLLGQYTAHVGEWGT